MLGLTLDYRHPLVLDFDPLTRARLTPHMPYLPPSDTTHTTTTQQPGQAAGEAANGG